MPNVQCYVHHDQKYDGIQIVTHAGPVFSYHMPVNLLCYGTAIVIVRLHPRYVLVPHHSHLVKYIHTNVIYFMLIFHNH